MDNDVTCSQVKTVRRAPTSTMKRTTSTERLLDVNEAAQMLSLSPKTLYDWAYLGRLPVVKLFGHALRFRVSVIQELIDRSERPAQRAA